MTDSSKIDDIARAAKEKLEHFEALVLLRSFRPEQATKQMLMMYQMIVALQAECEMLKVWVDELKAHQHAAEGAVIDAADQTSSDESIPE